MPMRMFAMEAGVPSSSSGLHARGRPWQENAILACACSVGTASPASLGGRCVRQFPVPPRPHRRDGRRRPRRRGRPVGRARRRGRAGRGRRAQPRPRGRRGLREPLVQPGHRVLQRAVHQLAEVGRRQSDPVVRADAPEPAELLRPVLRGHAGHHGRQLLHPWLLLRPQPGLGADRRRAQLGQLQRVAAEPGFDHVQQRLVRAQAQPLVRVLQRADVECEDLRPVPVRLLDAAPAVVRDPEPVQRHARLLGVHR
ncbi:hypothetical protein SGPA1_31052 [Streptomyces misionensis JCM 4497]